jgi:hypothetical protein
MRPRLSALLALALALAAPGCYVSLHPVVTSAVQVYEPALVGTWEEKDSTSNDRWVFTPESGEKPQAYVVEVTEHSSSVTPADPPGSPAATFEGRLGRFGDLLVLEIVPDGDKVLGPLKDGILASSLVPAATFFSVRLDRDALTLMAVDSKWMDKAIGSKTIRIAHEHIDADSNPHEKGQRDLHIGKSGPEGVDWILLTAPTSELQALVRRYGKAGLFDKEDAGEFVRKR